MKGRLVMIEPEKTESVAGVSPVVMETSRGIALIGDDWTVPLPATCLEDASMDDVRCALDLPVSVSAFLTGIREMPDTYPMSAEYIRFVASWWKDEVHHLSGQDTSFLKAS
jgi:hypothetical protein